MRNAGGGWTHDTFTDNGSNGTAGSGSVDGNGWFAGGQIGFNWQFATNWVIGVEADADWSDVKSSHLHCDAFVTGPFAGFTSGRVVNASPRKLLRGATSPRT